MDYNKDDLKKAYSESGVKKGRIVLLKTDLRLIGLYDQTDREGVLKAHFDVLKELIDFSQGTLVVCTSSTYLCNTETLFDIDNTKSERGVLTEYVRKMPGTVRSLHPFYSYTAIGKDAKNICQDVSRHAFGLETPKARMIERDALVLSVGLPPSLTCSTVHHVELMMSVPYRYSKEFIHPIKTNGRIVKEPYYLYVYYRECEIDRNRNIKIFDHFLCNGFKVKEVTIGRGKIFAYSMKEFFNSTVQLFKKDIYCWLNTPPKTRPYQK